VRFGVVRRAEQRSPALAVDGRAVSLVGLGLDMAPGDDPLLGLLRRGLQPERWADALERADLEELESRDLAWRLDQVELAAPVRRPAKVMCIGLNYRDHCRETGLAEPASPVLFAKFPGTVIGPTDAIQLPQRLSSQVDYEVELALVIGKRCADVGEARALDVVAGYTVANDVTARDLQAVEAQWTRCKSFDTFCPLGPWLATSALVSDPQRVELRLSIGGQRLQDSSTAEMIFSCAELVSWLSRGTTLEPGDLILTGTPAGVGAGRNPQRFLEAGDTVEAEAPAIGSLANPVIAA
jgi:2-keto-4-pentenoate hydratase/2-oxohepta-3-ene-1,7-dioic acid hydratase in catechol pathway